MTKIKTNNSNKTTINLDQNRDDILEIIEFAFMLLFKRSQEAKKARRQCKRKN